MKGQRSIAAVLLAVLGMVLATVGCMPPANEGTVVLSLTDSPAVASDVARAVIAITSIQYSLASDTGGSEVTWLTLVTYDTPQEFDLLALQGGAIAELADVSLPAGHIGQIRFVLAAPEATTGAGAPSTSGCYLELTDGSEVPLFVPSGSSSGFKATGAFDVPVNGSVEITADFDVRKSIVRRGVTDSYLLKPTIRLVVNAEAGGLNVSLTGADSLATVVVYAYEDGTYGDAEAAVPTSEADDPQFSGAVTSAIANATGSFVLRFLAAGTYDLVVAAYDAQGTFVEVAGVHQDAVVTSGTNASVAVDLATIPHANVVLSLTDSPVLASSVAKVVVAVESIEYSQSSDDGGSDVTWQTLVAFDTPQEFDLLSLQSGTVALLADVFLPAGHVGQIRFVLDAEETTTGGGAPATSGCYIELADGTTLPLFVPGGSSSGFKATGGFDVPVNGTVEITADFDVRKSVVQRGAQGGYLLKPTIRLVVDSEAGAIVVTLANPPADQTLVVYAYEDGAYDTATEQVAAADSALFPSAVSSATICDDGKYRLAYLAAGTYDLVVAAYDAAGAFLSVLTVQQDVVVSIDGNTPVTIDLAP